MFICISIWLTCCFLMVLMARTLVIITTHVLIVAIVIIITIIVGSIVAIVNLPMPQCTYIPAIGPTSHGRVNGLIRSGRHRQRGLVKPDSINMFS